MKAETEQKCYRILLWKAYFDKGYSLTNYVKYFIVLFGAYSVLKEIPIEVTIFAAIGYTLGCFILGRIWFVKRIVDIETEINNKFNPFVNQVRDKFGIPKNLNS